METNETEIQILAKTLENVTKMLTDVVLRQTELSQRQLDLFENGNNLIREMYENLKVREKCSKII